MTDTYAGYIVTLEEDLRSDDAQATLAALRQIKGVLDVSPVVQDVSGLIAESRAKHELFMHVIKHIYPDRQ